MALDLDETMQISKTSSPGLKYDGNNNPINMSSTLKSLIIFILGLFFGKHLSSSDTTDGVRGELATAVTNPPTPSAITTEPPKPPSCLDTLPSWARDAHAETLAKAFMTGSVGLTDKSTGHNYQILYHRYLSPMVMRMLCPPQPAKKKPRFRMLEIGLGCHPSGGMVRGEPGGSTRAWRHLFPPELFDLDLHVMEYDASCAAKWEAEHPGIATKVHSGDASSSDDLDRVVQDSGGDPFDMIIDDASHLNEHQIITFQHMIEHVAKDGIYIVEDIHSSCKEWKANFGTEDTGKVVQGTEGCMQTIDGKPTIFSKLIEWQKPLLTKESPFPDVTSIAIHFEAAVISKLWG